MGKSSELTLSEMIKRARKEKGLSARKLAKLCDVSHTEINNIESGTRDKPALLILKGLEKYLDLDFATMARMAGYSEDTIKYGDDNLTVSYEKYDKLIQDYRREIEHAAFTVEQKRRNAKDAKEYLDDISKYLETLDNVPEDIKKKLKNIYTLLDYIDTKYDAFTYYEPFIGGGALLFELAPKKAVINDYNAELINTYNVICDDDKFDKMCRELNKHEKNHSEDYYYEVRNKDRNKNTFNRLADYTRAARTIYLNKACFNGLYRVNSKNEFNVPFGKKIKVNTYERDNLLLVHSYLINNDVKILNVDFEESVKEAKKGDFIYFDPPYDSDTETFNSYTEDGFGKEEQKRLADVFKDLDRRGCYVMLSNHNTKLVNELYKDYNIHVIEAKRNINSNGKKRGKVEEVIVTNFENKKGFEE